MNKACWFGLLLLLGPGLAQADTLDKELSALKADVADLEAALLELEEDILYPKDTQLAVFLSLDVKDFFRLDAIELSVDGRQISSHIYSQQEHQALQRGGIQRLYLGQLSPGEYELTAVLDGKDANENYFRKQQTFSVVKEEDAARIELSLQAQASSDDLQFTMKRWQ